MYYTNVLDLIGNIPLISLKETTGLNIFAKAEFLNPGGSIKDRIAKGDKWAKLVYENFAYQLAKYIGSYACVLEGKVDAVVMTGGVSNDTDFIANVKKYAGWIAPVIVYGGDFEMEALASGAIRALSGEEETKEYTGEPVWNGFAFEP